MKKAILSTLIVVLFTNVTFAMSPNFGLSYNNFSYFTPPLIAAIACGAKNKSDVKKYMTEEHVNLADSNGILPLHIAIAEKNHEIILELLKNGANPVLKTKNPLNPLNCAEQMYFMEKDEDLQKIAILLKAASWGASGLDEFYKVLYASDDQKK